MSGTHIVCDLKINFDLLPRHDFDFFPTLVKEAVENSDAEVLNAAVHHFGNHIHAFSINYMLAESHCCLHTWPEDGYVSFDVFTCGKTEAMANCANDIYRYLVLRLSDLGCLETYSIEVLNRGIPVEQ